MARKGLSFGAKRYTKVKKLARAGWRGGVKPVLKKAGKVGLKGAKIVGKAAYDHPGAVNAAIGIGAANVGARVGAAVGVGTANPTAGAVAGLASEETLRRGTIHAKDKLLEHYFGTQHNAGSSHSGKNYAIKRKPAVRFNHPNESPGSKTERLVKTPEDTKNTPFTDRDRNRSHVTSASRPTGSKS